jgi:hypothetical protein
MTDKNHREMVGKGDNAVRASVVESVYRDDDGEYTATTYGCGCCSKWLNDHDLSDNDIEIIMRAILARHEQGVIAAREALHLYLKEGR